MDLPAAARLCSSAWYNGDIVPRENIEAALSGHGAQYAVGVIEGIRKYTGPADQQAFLTRDHVRRLIDGARQFAMTEETSNGSVTFPFTEDQLVQACLDMQASNNLNGGDWYVRPYAWLAPAGKPEPSQMFVAGHGNAVHVAIFATPLPITRTSVTLWITDTFVRSSARSAPVTTKSPMMFPMARRAKLDAEARGYTDVIILDDTGHIADSSAANFLFEIDGELVSPGAGYILHGKTLLVLAKLAEISGWPVVFRDIAPAELAKATEGLSCGTAMHARKISSISGKVAGVDKTFHFDDTQPKIDYLIKEYDRIVTLDPEEIDAILGTVDGAGLLPPS